MLRRLICQLKLKVLYLLIQTLLGLLQILNVDLLLLVRVNQLLSLLLGVLNYLLVLSSINLRRLTSKMATNLSSLLRTERVNDPFDNFKNANFLR